MTDLPTLTGQRIVKALERSGFVHTRTRGSHFVLRHPNGRWTTVPVHGRRDVEPRMLLTILREIHMDREEFLRLLRS